MQHIYRIVNEKTGKFYVGRSKEVSRRLTTHFNLLRSGIHFNRHLQNSFNYYGEDAFKTEILEEIRLDDETLELEKAIEREQYWLDTYFDTGLLYNLSRDSKTGVLTGEDHPCYGRDWLRERLSDDEYDDMMKRRSKMFTGENNPFYGRSHSIETINYLSEVCSSYGEDNSFYGKKHSEDTRRKLSEIQKEKRRKSSVKYGKSRSIRINDLIFPSIAAAKRYWRDEFSVGHTKFDRYIRDQLFDYEYLDDETYQQLLNAQRLSKSQM